MRLYLVRHGEAKDKEQDPERPLTEAGRGAVLQVAGFLKNAAAVSAREVRHSTKLRARQTAEALVDGLGLDAPVREVEGLEPLADVEELADALGRAERDLILVGHLPHLDRLASRLVAGDADIEGFDFPAAGTLALRREGGAWQVEWMVNPRLVR